MQIKHSNRQSNKSYVIEMEIPINVRSLDPYVIQMGIPTKAMSLVTYICNLRKLLHFPYLGFTRKNWSLSLWIEV